MCKTDLPGHFVQNIGHCRVLEGRNTYMHRPYAILTLTRDPRSLPRAFSG